MRRTALILAILFAPAAFAQATPTASISTRLSGDTYHEGMDVELLAIDGKPVESGRSLWSEDEDISYPLTPGSHTITLDVSAGTVSEKMDAVVFVAQGQRYQLGAQTVLDQQTQEPHSYIAWVQDSTGARVWTRQFNLITTVTHVPSPWQH